VLINLDLIINERNFSEQKVVQNTYVLLSF